MRFFFFAFVLLFSCDALADCTPGNDLIQPHTRTSWVEGGLVYDKASKVLKTCDGTNWATVNGNVALPNCVTNGATLKWNATTTAWTCQETYTSCKAAYDSGVTASGSYTIDVDGADPLPPITVYCDMTTNGGGWTLIARNNATTTFTNFNKDWATYKAGFGDLTNTIGWGWLGNDRLNKLIAGGKELQVRNNVQTHAYINFSVGDEASKYQLSVANGGGQNDNGTFASVHNNMKFSTLDQDNDNKGSSNCAVEHAAGWWYNTCYHMTIAGNNTGQVYWRNAAGNSEYVTWIEMWVR